MNHFTTLYHLIFVVKIKIMKVCIMGSGLTSLTLAKALVNQNIFVDMFDLKKSSSINKSRTLGISYSNVEFFNNNIINIEKIIWKLKKIEIFTDNLKNEKLLNFERNNKEIFSIIKNYKLYDILNKSLKQNKLFNKINSKNFLLLNNYDLIINTSYFNSITRKYFSRKIIKEYNSLAYTAIIKHQKIENNIATQIFTKLGPIAFLPISNNQTSVVFSIKNNLIKKRNDIPKLIHTYNYKYKILNISKIESFELKSLNLRTYYYNNILAFGDLLHRLHPLAGQGFNMTIRDIKILIKIINDKFNLGLPLDSSVNKEFEKQSRDRNFIFSNSIDFVHEFFNFERKSKNNLLSKSVQFLGKTPSLNKVFMKIADEGLIF